MKEAVGRTIASLSPRIPEARWVPKHNAHVTLAFLGGTTFVERVKAAVREGVADLPALTLQLEGLGAFPSEARARVIWVGLSGDVDVLADVAAAVWAAIEPLGFEPEDRPFAAHVTIARLRMPQSVDLSPGRVEPVEFRVSSIAVFESKLQRPAPVYEVLEAAPLRD